MAQYSTSAKVIIVLPFAAEVACAQSSNLHPRLQARIIELSAYECVFEAGDGAWEVLGQIARTKWEPLIEDDLQPKFWEHEDKVLRRPKTITSEQLKKNTEGYRLYFGGGCSKAQGYGGYVLYDDKGSCLQGEGRWYGYETATNNEAEAHALVSGFELLDKLELQG